MNKDIEEILQKNKVTASSQIKKAPNGASEAHSLKQRNSLVNLITK